MSPLARASARSKQEAFQPAKKHNCTVCIMPCQDIEKILQDADANKDGVSGAWLGHELLRSCAHIRGRVWTKVVAAGPGKI